MRFAYAKSIGLRRLAYISGNPAFVTAFNTASGVEPTLVLDYENDSYWEDQGGTDTFANLHTFTRASEATRVNASGLIETVAADVARLDHDKDGNPLGLLVEEARTNMLLRSEEFDLTWKVLNTAVTANAATAPDGANSADEVEDDATNDRHIIFQDGLTTAANTLRQFSIFLKNNTRRYAQVQLRKSGEGYGVIVDLTDGSVTDTLESGTPTQTGHSVEDFGNGWYRVTVEAEVTVADLNAIVALSDAAVPTYGSADNPSYSGSGESIYLWGAQLEQGSFATSYIPTAGSSVTRAADVPSTATSAFGFNASAGALYAVVTPNHTPSAEMILASLNDGTADERIEIVADASANVDFDVIDGGASQASIDSTVNAAADTQLKAAAAYAVNDFAVSVDGNTAQTDGAGTLPTVDTLVPIDNGHIKALVYYAERLSNSDLVALTT